MDRADFDRINDTFLAFHAEFAPTLGRKEWRLRSQDYLRGLLVQTQERGNAENLSEAVEGASERVLQRFLTEAQWDDAAVTAHLQRYLAPRLTHPDAVWAVDGSSFPKQGKKSVGVARQYCGALGKVANCQVGVFLAHVGPRGRALVGKRLYLPREWIQDPARCTAAAVPADQQTYQSQSELALALLREAKQWGHLTAPWVTGDDEYGQSPAFRDGVADEGWQYVLEVPSATPVWPREPTWVTRPYRGRGRPPVPQPVAAERREARERAAALPATAWTVLTVAEGAQGPRTYRFACERVRDSREGQPGVEVWLLHRQNLDGSEPRYYFSNAGWETPLGTLARISASRWPIETEFKEEKSQVALDEYEVRRWPGWHHHITMCFLAAAFLLTLQQEWGEKDAPAHAAAGASDRVRTAAAQALDPRPTVGVATQDAVAQRAGQAVARPAAAIGATRAGGAGAGGPGSLISSL